MSRDFEDSISFPQESFEAEKAEKDKVGLSKQAKASAQEVSLRITYTFYNRELRIVLFACFRP